MIIIVVHEAVLLEIDFAEHVNIAIVEATASEGLALKGVLLLLVE